MISMPSARWPRGWKLTKRPIAFLRRTRPRAWWIARVSCALIHKPRITKDRAVRMTPRISFALRPSQTIVEQQSNYKRDQCFHFALIATILIAELLDHQGLFDAGLQPPAGQEEPETDQTADLVHAEGGAQQTQQNPGVNGMANQRVGAAQDQLMPLLQSNLAAPVLSQDETRPYRKCKTASGHRQAEIGHRGVLRQEARGEEANS